MEAKQAGWNRALTGEDGARVAHANPWQPQPQEGADSAQGGNAWLRPAQAIERPVMTSPPRLAPQTAEIAERAARAEAKPAREAAALTGAASEAALASAAPSAGFADAAITAAGAAFTFAAANATDAAGAAFAPAASDASPAADSSATAPSLSSPIQPDRFAISGAAPSADPADAAIPAASEATADRPTRRARRAAESAAISEIPAPNAAEPPAQTAPITDALISATAPLPELSAPRPSAPSDASPRRRRARHADEPLDLSDVHHASTYSVTAAARKEADASPSGQDEPNEPDEHAPSAEVPGALSDGRDAQVDKPAPLTADVLPTDEPAPESGEEDDEEDDGEEAYPHTPEPVPVPTLSAATEPGARQGGGWKLLIGALCAIAILSAVAVMFFIGKL